MQYRVARDGRAITVALNGQLDLDANEKFAAMLRDLEGIGTAQVVFDLSGLTHMDSVGLGLLYIAQEELDRGGNRLALSMPSGPVKRLLELTESGQTFEIHL